MRFLLSASSRKSACPVVAVTEKTCVAALKRLGNAATAWAQLQNFTGKPATALGIPAENGALRCVLAGIPKEGGIWSLAHLPNSVPEGVYALDTSALPASLTTPEMLERMASGWGLACYADTRFKRQSPPPRVPASLLLPRGVNRDAILRLVESTLWVRDLINAPANLLGPAELADEALRLARAHQAKVQVLVGEEVLRQNYPAVYEVGKGSPRPPHLVDFRWGKASSRHPRITLVGKGVCFDSGGLDIKSASTMKLMKKDMGGAAVVLGLARMIMEAQLPVRLRVLIPAVENSVDGVSFRPLDIISTRKGLSVEVGDTDAEGRLILCDALHEADTEEPDLLIDCATLTGAARVALGTDVPAFFTPSDALARELESAAKQEHDPLWRLPLVAEYAEQLNTPLADISSISTSSYGGAITAALFLQRFVPGTKNWVHLDMMAWNLTARPGRPIGGEAMGLRALYALVQNHAGR
jgi:leucyl aminopeptidase